MKQLYAVLVLALVLVFAMGSVASAGILRGEDYDRPASDPLDIEDPDEDHPWGGDRVVFDPGTDIRTDDPQVVTLTTTSYLYIDLWLSTLYRLFISDEPIVTTTTQFESSSVLERSYRSASPASLTVTGSRILDGKVVSR